MTTKTLDIILNLKLTIAIGMNWFKVSTLEVLGRRTTLLDFILWNNLLFGKELNHNITHIIVDYTPIFLKE